MLLFSSRCMLELKFAIYYRAASLPSQASYAVLAEESQAFFKHFPHTNSISNSAILRNNYISLLSDLCACVHLKKKLRRKGSHSSSVSGSNRLVWLQTWKKAMGWCTAQWKMLLFCAKTIVKESCKFELARLKKKKKKKTVKRNLNLPSESKWIHKVRTYRKWKREETTFISQITLLCWNANCAGTSKKELELTFWE